MNQWFFWWKKNIEGFFFNILAFYYQQNCSNSMGFKLSLVFIKRFFFFKWHRLISIYFYPYLYLSIFPNDWNKLCKFFIKTWHEYVDTVVVSLTFVFKIIMIELNAYVWKDLHVFISWLKLNFRYIILLYIDSFQIEKNKLTYVHKVHAFVCILFHIHDKVNMYDVPTKRLSYAAIY